MHSVVELLVLSVIKAVRHLRDKQTSYIPITENIRHQVMRILLSIGITLSSANNFVIQVIDALKLPLYCYSFRGKTHIKNAVLAFLGGVGV
jgi:hypothetical protein